MPHRRVAIIALAVACLVLVAGPSPARAADLSQGILATAVAPGRDNLPTWVEAMRRSYQSVLADANACALGASGGCPIGPWMEFVKGLLGADRTSALRKVNSFINGIPYRRDAPNWGRPDFWATPGEFFARGGDCEDYAITKYYTLRALGFRSEDLRIVVLRDLGRDVLHAVLVVEDQGVYQVLDNRRQFIVTWDDVPDYRPLFSVNETSYWLHLFAGKS